MGRLLSGRVVQETIKDVVVPHFPVDATLLSFTPDTCPGTEMLLYLQYNMLFFKPFNYFLRSPEIQLFWIQTNL